MPNNGLREKEKIIFLANPRGFCAGVKNAVFTVERLLRKYGKNLYVHHEIVHNRHIIDNFKKKGVTFVENINDVPIGARIVFSAHGVSAKTEMAARKRKLKINDATCPIVKKIHSKAVVYSKKNYVVILIGHPNHPEIAGTAGRINGEKYIVETADDAVSLPALKGKEIACLTQTTLNPDDTSPIYNIIKEKYGNALIPFKSDICYATKERQNAVRKLAEKCDLIFVIGSKNSSNSMRLLEIAHKCGTKALLLEDEKQITKKSLKNIFFIGITAGASAPEEIVQKTISKLKCYGWKRIVESRKITD